MRKKFIRFRAFEESSNFVKDHFCFSCVGGYVFTYDSLAKEAYAGLFPLCSKKIKINK